jgi:hypothetical protein
MEKSWEKKLLFASAEYQEARSDAKREKLFNHWKEVSSAAMAAARDLTFEEILSWLNLTAGIEAKDYFNILREKAENEQQDLLTLILSGQTQFGTETKAESLAMVIERIWGKLVVFGIDDTLSKLVSSRPDILLHLSTPVLKKEFPLSSGFLTSDKLELFLSCFTNSQEICSFANKLNQDSSTVAMLQNERVLEYWNQFSNQELSEVIDSKTALAVYKNAHPDWRSDLKNFKSILQFIDHEYFESFISHIRVFHKVVNDEHNFYIIAAFVAAEKMIEKKLADGDANFKKLFYEAPRGEMKISKTKRKIIEKFLE